MNLLRKLFRYLFKEQKANYYKSINEFPVWNWWEIHKTGELSLLVIDGKIDKTAIDVFESLKNEFIDTFGLSNEYDKIRKKEIDIKILEIRLALKQDRTVLVKIDMIKREIETIKASMINDVRDPVGKNIRIIEKYRKFELDPKKTSVASFYGYIEDIKQQIEWQNQKR